MSDELFSQAAGGNEAASPLADRMRPRNLDEFVGQHHIVGPGRLLRRAILRDRLSSIILSGPPGTGKTTLARVIANATSARFVAINAVLSGVQAIRDTIESAKQSRDLYNRKTILFVDEVHRWNKAQQDALLPSVENGTVILVGATTENPFFEVNKALVSRSRVFQLQALAETDLLQAARQALADKARGYGRWQIEFGTGALEHLVHTAGGDARALLNALELAIETSTAAWPAPDGATITVSLDTAEQSIQKRAILYDKDGDAHYDTISAFIKSIRGSDPDASLYWLARMLYAGEDPHFIFRRLLISASEDIGLADPQAIATVQACAAAFDRLGLPEGQFPLAEATLYLATAAKSNSGLAFFAALAAVEAEQAEVPNHLKDGSRDSQGLGHGAGYAYPHAYRDHWANQQYLPDSLKGLVFYQPGKLGYEATIRDTVLERRDLQLAAMASPADAEILPLPMPGQPENGKRNWRQRVAGGQAAAMAAVQATLLAWAECQRHENVLLVAADDGALARQIFRACPDGSLTCLVDQPAQLERLQWLFADCEEILKPLLLLPDEGRRAVSPGWLVDKIGHRQIECLITQDWLTGVQPGRVLSRQAPDRDSNSSDWASCFPAARLIGSERLPPATGILSLHTAGLLPDDLQDRFRRLDDGFYAAEQAKQLQAITNQLAEAGYALQRQAVVEHPTERRLSVDEIEKWLGAASAWGRHLRQELNEADSARLAQALKELVGRDIAWPRCWWLYRGVCRALESEE
ncbi:MAG: hypothetical protein A2087_10265 [Spirochaetes bacterium GWD1_61_31]|nr:MAG: hypothetical protein A2Y37_12250 [Spirochaetes bacterium GWB1_60_80]OHD30144.1 MAG: hypothetical protein A2004_14115 [Spirochaetes bacterium GWC1_61_12]OHD34601.1 MAG: hypothetical protein A2087_10265 [Spirochaetes bacterium GWD1_61_31]OHD46417.1 MAG: hypothetical protein A2Y35_10170 [Spirochaetes bacterium GWE1_60_18]OHD59473.1 MAG: hypothetical protein A2Y32_10125 [Spirochaetes bacterium GWF1_60_12]HAP43533.1 recombinase RarA [Spirochaetaceae bacterium]